MMLWTAPAPAPNPRRVQLFLAAKGLAVPTTELSLMKREHKSDGVLAMNSRGQVPFLELDDGRVLAETVAICRYLDELHPEPPMFGTTPFERAETDMWVRRVESALGVPVSLVWQHGHPMTARLVTQIPAMADQARGRAMDAMAWLDSELAHGDWLAGARPTMADIVLLTTLDFGVWIGLDIPESATALRGWHERAKAFFV
nr:glutathione S-transferase family protein [Polymorphobacter sp.]